MYYLLCINFWLPCRATSCPLSFAEKTWKNRYSSVVSSGKRLSCGVVVVCVPPACLPALPRPGHIPSQHSPNPPSVHLPPHHRARAASWTTPVPLLFFLSVFEESTESRHWCVCTKTSYFFSTKLHKIFCARSMNGAMVYNFVITLCCFMMYNWNVRWRRRIIKDIGQPGNKITPSLCVHWACQEIEK